MNTFYLRVISSNKVFFDDKVTKFVLPLEDGEMAVLPHHENMIIATSIGEIRIDTPDGKKKDSALYISLKRLIPKCCHG